MLNFQQTRTLENKSKDSIWQNTFITKKSKLSSLIVWYIHVTFTDCGLILIVSRSGCKFNLFNYYNEYQNSHLIAKYLYTELNSKAYNSLNCLAINSSQISENIPVNTPSLQYVIPAVNRYVQVVDSHYKLIVFA